MGRKGIYPAPVYEAHFADGSIGRCSFWSPVGKPIDFEHGRRVAAQLWSRPSIDSVALKSQSTARNAASFFETHPPKPVNFGWVEHETIGRVYHLPGSAPIKAARVDARAQCRSALAALRRGDSAAALRILGSATQS